MSVHLNLLITISRGDPVHLTFNCSNLDTYLNTERHFCCFISLYFCVQIFRGSTWKHLPTLTQYDCPLGYSCFPQASIHPHPTGGWTSGNRHRRLLQSLLDINYYNEINAMWVGKRKLVGAYFHFELVNILFYRSKLKL